MAGNTWPHEVIDPHIHQWDPYSTPRHVSTEARLLRHVPRIARATRWVLRKADREFIGNPHHVLKPYNPVDYRRDAGRLPVATVVHIEAAWVAADHHGCVDETRWVSALPFAQNGAPRLGAIVVHTDPRWPDAGAVLDAHLAASPLVRGVRYSAAHHPDPGVRDFADTPHSLREHAFLCGFAAVAERRLSFELWCYAHQLPDAAVLAREYPQTIFVLDHYATPVGIFGPRGRDTGHTPRERADILARWRDDIAALAALPNVVAKHSGLGMPLLGGQQRHPADASTRAHLIERSAPLIRHLHDCFGPARTMWASNYPIDKPGHTISTSAHVLLDVLGADADPQQLFHDVARRTYGIDRPVGAQPLKPDAEPAANTPTDRPPLRHARVTSRTAPAPDTSEPNEGIPMLENKIVLITGAAGGIGAGTAARLAARGAVPVLADVDEDALRRTAASLPGQPLTVPVDVTDMASCRSAVAAALKRHDRLDAVWANAGISVFAPLELTDDAAWRHVIEVNLLGAFNIIKAALPPVIDSRGYVAITASGASWAHSPGHSAYAASKAAVEALGNSLRVELADRGVDVGVFHPQWINTAMVTQKQEHNDAFNVFFDSLPAPLRTMTPVEEMADVLVDAFARRATRVVYPRFSWLLYALRALLPTRPLTVTTRKVAPEIRRAYARQIQQDSNPVAPAGTTM